MKITKKICISTGVLLTISAPMAAIVSCGTGESNQSQPPKNDPLIPLDVDKTQEELSNASKLFNESLLEMNKNTRKIIEETETLKVRYTKFLYGEGIYRNLPGPVPAYKKSIGTIELFKKNFKLTKESVLKLLFKNKIPSNFENINILNIKLLNENKAASTLDISFELVKNNKKIKVSKTINFLSQHTYDLKYIHYLGGFRLKVDPTKLDGSFKTPDYPNRYHSSMTAWDLHYQIKKIQYYEADERNTKIPKLLSKIGVNFTPVKGGYKISGYPELKGVIFNIKMKFDTNSSWYHYKPNYSRSLPDKERIRIAWPLQIKDGKIVQEKLPKFWYDYIIVTANKNGASYDIPLIIEGFTHNF